MSVSVPGHKCENIMSARQIHTTKEIKYWQKNHPFDVNVVEFISRVAIGVLSHFVIFV